MPKPGTKSTLVRRHRTKRKKQQKAQHTKLKQTRNAATTNELEMDPGVPEGKAVPILL